MCKVPLAVLFVPLALMAQTSPGGIIQGTVTSEDNRPIAGAFVTAMRSALPPVSQTAKSGADGSFQVLGLPAGAYSLCVQVSGDGYLDPCRWAATVPTVTLAAGQRSAGNLVKLKAGSILKVRIQDPGNLKDRKTADGREPDLSMGVFGPRGIFYPVHITGKDNAGADYQLTVPRDTPVKFSILSKNLKLADANGAALPGNASQQAFQHATGDANPRSFRYTIIGVLP